MVRILVLALAGLLVSCATTKQVQPGRQNIGDSYAIDTASSWTRISINPTLSTIVRNWPRVLTSLELSTIVRTWPYIPTNPTLWTIEGVSLGRLETWAGLAPGQTLFEMDSRTPPVFRPEFTGYEIAKMVADTVEIAIYGSDVVVSNLVSATFAGASGFRFELSYVENGLPMRGTAFGAVRQDKLDLMLFIAPREYYFDKYQPQVEKIFESVRAI